jgi:hypothetical protein
VAARCSYPGHHHHFVGLPSLEPGTLRRWSAQRLQIRRRPNGLLAGCRRRYFRRSSIDGTDHICQCATSLVCVGRLHGPRLGARHSHYGMAAGNGVARARNSASFIDATTGSFRAVAAGSSRRSNISFIAETHTASVAAPLQSHRCNFAGTQRPMRRALWRWIVVSPECASRRRNPRGINPNNDSDPRGGFP